MLPIQEKLMRDASRKFDQSVRAIMNATGKLAQAETLTDTINASMVALGWEGGFEYIAVTQDHLTPVEIYTLLYINRAHDQLRAALAHAGLEISAEETRKNDFDNSTTVVLELRDFAGFKIYLKYPRAALKEAA